MSIQVLLRSVITPLMLLVLTYGAEAQMNLYSDAIIADFAQEAKDRGGDNGAGSIPLVWVPSPGEPVRTVRKADLFVCNATHHHTVSVAYSVGSPQRARVRGWWNIRKDKCMRLVGQAAHVKFYAFGGTSTWSDQNPLWKDEPLYAQDPYALCIHPRNEFNVKVKAEVQRCPQGFIRVRFKGVHPGVFDTDGDGKFYVTLRSSVSGASGSP